MLSNLSQVLDRAASEVPAVLWSPRAVGRMRAALERFPPLEGPEIGPVRWGVIGLELRLSETDDQVDLAFPLLAEDRDAIVTLAGIEGNRWLREAPHWSRIGELCRRWAAPGGLLARWVRLSWLELDIDGSASHDDVPAPGILVRLHPETTREADRGTWRELLAEVLHALTGDEASPALVEGFERWRRCCPPSVHVQYVGLMLSRGAGAVRFLFGGAPDTDWATFLHDSGFPRSASELRDGLDRVCVASGGRVHPGPSALQVDLTAAGVLSRFGCEYVLDRRAQVDGTVAERRFLEHLAATGLCGEAKLEALLGLPGRSVSRWDDRFQVGHSRRIHHVKLVFHAQTAVEAKAYFGRSLTIEPLPASAAPARRGGEIHPLH